MFVRCAFFKGRIKPGSEDAFDSIVEERLMPLWARFPGVDEVRVLRQIETDSETQPLPLVVLMSFQSRAAIDTALSSPVRGQSRAASQELLAHFEGEVFHTVFIADELPVEVG
jgi:hypothetical protein